MATLVGGLVGGLLGGSGGGGSQQQTKDPWGPAQKPLQNTLNTGQNLETYYQQNPFNPLQQTGYQNLFSDLDNFRTNVAPQAQAFNNRLMGTNYTRAPAGTELGGSMQQINASQFLPPEQRTQMTKPMQMGGAVNQTKPMQMGGGGLSAGIGGMGNMGGLSGLGSALSMAQQGQSGPLTQGLLSAPQQGMTVVPNSNNSLYGLLNWKELNPFTATNGIPKTPTDTNTGTDLTDDQAFAAAYDRYMRQREQESNRYYGGGGS
jgi:hypothetical protein